MKINTVGVVIVSRIDGTEEFTATWIAEGMEIEEFIGIPLNPPDWGFQSRQWKMTLAQFVRHVQEGAF